MDTWLIEMVARHEGFRATVYCDACRHELYFYQGDEPVWLCGPECKGGNLTVGYGTRVDGAGLDKDDAASLLANRLERDHEELLREPWYVALDDRRRDAILDMAYTMGVAGVKQFKRMIAFIESQDWEHAASEVMLSKWGKEAKLRSAEVAGMIIRG